MPRPMMLNNRTTRTSSPRRRATMARRVWASFATPYSVTGASRASSDIVACPEISRTRRRNRAPPRVERSLHAGRSPPARFRIGCTFAKNASPAPAPVPQRERSVRTPCSEKRCELGGTCGQIDRTGDSSPPARFDHRRCTGPRVASLRRPGATDESGAAGDQHFVTHRPEGTRDVARNVPSRSGSRRCGRCPTSSNPRDRRRARPAQRVETPDRQVDALAPSNEVQHPPVKEIDPMLTLKSNVGFSMYFDIWPGGFSSTTPKRFT